MLQLYDINHNKISPLTKYKDLKIERELTGEEVLSFSYPYAKSEEIKEEAYIRTKKQEFVIKEIDDSGEWINVIAKVNLETIKGHTIDRIDVSNTRLDNALGLALTGTGWTIVVQDGSKRRTIRKANCSVYNVLEEIAKVYKVEYRFDVINKTLYAYNSRGSDKGSYFSDELNLRKLSIKSNSYDYCTRIIPIGKDGLTIKSINNGKNYVENHQYSNKVITIIWEDNRYTDVQSLMEDAILKLEELSKPIKSYSADIIDLAKLNEKYKDILDYDLGDTITLLSRDKKINEKQRIVKIVEYPDEPERNTCEIANRTLTFEDMQKEVLNAKDTVDTVTTSDGMIDDSKVNFDPIRQEFGAIVAEKADIVDLNAAVARIGTLETTSATITQLEAVEADINDLYANKATIEDLTAATGRISILESDVANIDTILAKEVFVELAEVGQIVAGSGIIAEGAIGSAQISDLDVSKLNAGIIDTAKFTVQGSGGRLVIQDNLLQVFDGTTDLFERIALGDINKDGSMYGIRIRGADGSTILLDENGLTDKGFTDGYNKLDNDSLDPAKIDIAKVVTRINEGTTTIEGSKIFMDNKTLDVAFSTIETTVNDQGETISSQQSQISALDSAIQLKVDTQTYTSDMEGINSQLSTQSSAIDVLQGQIALKVEQADIDNTIDPLETRISTAEATIETQATQISAKVETSTFNSTVDSITGEIDTLEGRVNSAEVDIDGLNSQISLKADATYVDGIETRVSSAELDIDGLEGEIQLKVNKNGIISEINQSPEEVKINANRLKIGMGTTFQEGVQYTWEQYAGKTWNEVM